jgi:hypothetical protein
VKRPWPQGRPGSLAIAWLRTPTISVETRSMACSCHSRNACDWALAPDTPPGLEIAQLHAAGGRCARSRLALTMHKPFSEVIR